MNNNSILCQNCIFWVQVSNDFGECRRKPPIPAVNPKTADPFTRALFPNTRDTDWCGEFRPQKGPKPAPPPQENEELLEM